MNDSLVSYILILSISEIMFKILWKHCLCMVLLLSVSFVVHVGCFIPSFLIVLERFVSVVGVCIFHSPSYLELKRIFDLSKTEFKFPYEVNKIKKTSKSWKRTRNIKFVKFIWPSWLTFFFCSITRLLLKIKKNQ